MSKLVILKWANILVFVCLLLQMGTGIGLLAAPSEGLGDFHVVNGFVFGGLALVHLALNWGWVKANFFRKTA